MNFTCITFLMILCHIIDDFVLQPICLSKLKQHDWWVKECQTAKLDITPYKHDYLCALFIHALSWSIMITLPWIIYGFNISGNCMLIMVITNTVIHALVDHIKANKKKINLITDQSIHLIQILITAIVYTCNVFYLITL